MTIRPDLLVRRQDGKPVAVIEIKNSLNLSRDVAAEMRRNLLDYGLQPSAPYFMLLSQDTGFLWNGVDEDGAEAQPEYEFPMESIVARYLRTPNSNVRLRGPQLELLVLQWLLDLTNGSLQVTDEPEKSLALSGLLDSLKGADIELESRI
jgi:hypothetical protein